MAEATDLYAWMVSKQLLLAIEMDGRGRGGYKNDNCCRKIVSWWEYFVKFEEKVTL